MRMNLQGRIALLAMGLAACLATSACIWIFRRVAVEEVRRGTDSVTVVSTVKAHLMSGHSVLYPTGVTLARDTLWGAGTRYDLALHEVGSVTRLPLDSVLGMESYRTAVNGAASAIVSTVTTLPLVAAAAVAIACALDPKCFGSCPTYYSDSAGTGVLEAEGFSYSIAPLFEARDVDRLRTQPDRDGTLRLEVRDEAFETHYTNQMTLLEARRGPDEYVVPDVRGGLLSVRGTRAPVAARDWAGRDLRRALTDADGDAFRTNPGTLAAAGPGALEDAVELTFIAPADADSAALVFRMRNSLLNTVLLYDVMLGDAGARSLDWITNDLDRIGPAVQLGQWYAAHMGMQVAVWRDGAWQDVDRIRDTGPVAWKDVAMLVPASPGDTLRVRLSFVADNWRIDRVAAAFTWRRPVARPYPLARIVDALGATDTAALSSLTAADQRYLETVAGQRFTAEWHPGPEDASSDSLRSFFLASQGYYVEWIRRGWLAAPRSARTFVPNDHALADALARYRVVKDTLERQFAATRVPVR